MVRRFRLFLAESAGAVLLQPQFAQVLPEPTVTREEAREHPEARFVLAYTYLGSPEVIPSKKFFGLPKSRKIQPEFLSPLSSFLLNFFLEECIPQATERFRSNELRCRTLPGQPICSFVTVHPDVSRHSVDSGFSLRSQHADRIRWPNRLRYQQQRSVSDLDLAYKSKAVPPPLPLAPPPPRTADLEYLDNPAENLEFTKKRVHAPKTRVDDEYYRHLTARNHQERYWQGLPPLPAIPSVPNAAPGLRRSHSLAVIREETSSAPLIPRARLVDKPSYKDRLLLRSKYQSKEDIEQIYSKSTSSCYGAIADGPRHKEESTFTSRGEAVYEDTRKLIHSVNGWVPSSTERKKKLVHHSDEVVLSRNPSEIDSLDSNYIHKTFNFEAHQNNTYKESSSDSTENSVDYRSKALYVRSDKDDKDNYYSRESKERNLSSFNRTNKCTIERSKSLDDVLCTFDIHNSYTKECDDNTLTKSSTKDNLEASESFHSDEESCQSLSASIRTDKDNISETSYITISPLSTNNSIGRLENLAASLADKIDEYCESKYSESFVEIPLHLQSAGNSFNSKSFDDLKSIYTKVNKIKHKNSFSDSKLRYSCTENQSQKSNSSDHYIHKQYLKSTDDFKTRSLYRQSSSSRNITTEPFVYTLIENQYYSLPDINVSKCLKRFERIDAKLRQQDRHINPYIKRLEVPYNNEPLSIQTEVSEEDESRLNEISIIEIKDAQKNEYDTIQECPEDVRQTELDTKPEPNYDTVQSEGEFIPPINTLHKKEKQLVQEKHNCIDTYETKAVTLESSTEDKKHSSETIFTNSAKLQLNSEIRKKFTDISNSRSSTKEKSLERNKSEEAALYESIDLIEIGKKRNKVTKHYSLRQREAPSHRDFILPNPPTESCNNIQEIKQVQLKRSIQRYNSFNGKDLNYPNFNKGEGKTITILPLSGHQTIIIEPPNKKLDVKVIDNHETSEESDDSEHKYDTVIEFDNLRKPPDSFVEKLRDAKIQATTRQIPRVKRERSLKIAEVQNKFEKPPNRLIIKDKIFHKKSTEMSRPQILAITDSKRNSITQNHSCDKKDNTKINERKSSITAKGENNSDKAAIKNVYNVTEKVDKVVKTDIEYQEKLHSVKNYWSKLIDNQVNNASNIDDDTKKPDRNTESNKSSIPQDTDRKATCIDDIIKSIETVKIVDSIKKRTNENEIIDTWKKSELIENEKDESVDEENPIKKIISDSAIFIEKAYDTLKESVKLKPNTQTIDAKNETKTDYKSLSPDIEIVEIGSNDPDKAGSDGIKHATLIKTKSLNDEECSEFDHIRYKIMKSDLFRKSMIASSKKEAQFDGLIQYLQDYSFQELLVNNNIVIIEPVRTKIEIPNPSKGSINSPNRCRVTGSSGNQNENKTNGTENSKQRKSALRKHFFYHPIRVNKEIIEEELPNPDTVKTVRNLFEGTLRMRRPGDSSDPCLIKESTTEMPKRIMHHKNLSIDSKLDSSCNARKISKYLTIDTSYGHKKWDSVSLSSGVSSGDLSSNNEHDYDTDALSPYQGNKANTDHMYTSSSEEYLCESLNANLCYESQYVSQDILQKIRECGTSITYYGGKVLDEKSGPAVSPMTKAIMEEIRGLQRNCCRDCTICQTKCTDGKCICLSGAEDGNKLGSISEVENLKHCPCSDVSDTKYQSTFERSPQNASGRSDHYLGFKFKLVKSNSCSSRLELAGTGDEHQDNNDYKTKTRKSVDDPPIIYDSENSVKTKIFRIESYRKGIVNSPFSENIRETDSAYNSKDASSVENHIIMLNNKSDDEKQNNLEKDVESGYSNIGITVKITPYSTIDRKRTNNGEHKKLRDSRTKNKIDNSEEKCVSVTETIRPTNDPKKYYYINSDNNNDGKKFGKFGEMEFEEFEVLDPSQEKCKRESLEEKQ